MPNKLIAMWPKLSQKIREIRLGWEEYFCVGLDAEHVKWDIWTDEKREVHIFKEADDIFRGSLK